MDGVAVGDGVVLFVAVRSAVFDIVIDGEGVTITGGMRVRLGVCVGGIIPTRTKCCTLEGIRNKTPFPSETTPPNFEPPLVGTSLGNSVKDSYVKVTMSKANKCMLLCGPSQIRRPSNAPPKHGAGGAPVL